MPRPQTQTPRRLADPRGAVLIISLLLLVVATFLVGLILLLARTEATISSTSRGSLQATNAAEYGIELAANGLDPAVTPTAFTKQTLASGVTVTAGLRNGTFATPQNLGASPCPAGYSASLGCTAFTLAATGSARAWFAMPVSASTQIQKSESIFRGCNGTEYSC